MDERKEIGSHDLRRREEASIRLEERFEGFLKTYDRNENEKQFKMERLEARLKPLEDLVMSAQGPIRLALWITSLIIASWCFSMGAHFLNVVKRMIH